ncbi:ATP-binding cassette domain-containing protein [Tessaracoccus coleopterorum]|uniref:ATP-binding cassette domain-containing protein n=1 Tax=Tessaracoccus coleopterorum TaxID=2714950 RepID=UPI001E48C54B|nr:ATP-binding cassette domain-containing protein [Tessaracoccus coleopterorum]
MAGTDSGIGGRVPVVIVDDLHVKYRVFASGKSAGNARSGLLNMTRGVREVHALKGISFTAYENETIGVIGSNGSGKSTLMRALTGLTPPASGAVYARSRPNLLGVGPRCSPTSPAPATSSSAAWPWASPVTNSRC